MTEPRGRNSRDEAQPCYPNIPEEIILQILPRLPLNSLSRFKCVSKNWLSLISDISVTKRGREMLLVLAHNLLHSIDIEKSRGKRVYESKESTDKCRAIYGSCNGLVLLGIDDDFFLWNPLTSYFKKVLHYDKVSFKHDVSGLCYDSFTDEYKVVLARNFSKSLVVGSFKNKSWTHVDCSFASYMILFFYSGPTVNERLHWCVTCVSKKDLKFKHSQILYFDPQPGTFKEVPMPQPKQSDGDVIYSLGVMDRCLCMSRRSENPSNDVRNYIEVLVMKEYGEANSWSLMFVVSNLMPLGYTNNGEALTLELPPGDKTTGVWHVRVYNPMENLTTDIPIPTPMPNFCGKDVLIYEESLIKPTDYNWEEEELREEATYTEYFLDGCHDKWTQDTCWYGGKEGSGWTSPKTWGTVRSPTSSGGTAVGYTM